MAKVKFNATKEEKALIDRIVSMASRIAKRHNTKLDKISLSMDVEACHCNGNKLKLTELALAADDFNFSHDVFGISRHIDRTTGKLGNHFLPRYSAHA